MKKALGILLVFMMALSFLISCSKSNPTTPQPTATNTPTATATATQTGLFVERADIIQSQSSHGAGTASATIILRYGNASGSYVQGATVSIGAASLTNSSPGTYTTALSNIGDGLTLNLSISSLAGNATSSINSPWDGAFTTPSSDGGYQSATAIMPLAWEYWTIIGSGTVPQKERLVMVRLSDSQVFVNNKFSSVLGRAETLNLPANTLPTSGIIYMRIYGINEGAITGANGGSVTFSMENSENTYYVNMTP